MSSQVPQPRVTRTDVGGVHHSELLPEDSASISEPGERSHRVPSANKPNLSRDVDVRAAQMSSVFSVEFYALSVMPRIFWKDNLTSLCSKTFLEKGLYITV